jgi:hypothetical protein
MYPHRVISVEKLKIFEDCYSPLGSKTHSSLALVQMECYGLSWKDTIIELSVSIKGAIMRIILALLIFLYHSTIFASDIMVVVKCLAENSGVIVLTTDYIDKAHTDRNKFIVETGGQKIEFNETNMTRHKDYPVSAVGEGSEARIIYYIPNEEISHAKSPYKGRILFMLKKEGKISKIDSRGFDATCVIGKE